MLGRAVLLLCLVLALPACGGGGSSAPAPTPTPGPTGPPTILVSVDSLGTQATADSNTLSISADGRYIAFASDAPNLVVGDANALMDVFHRDTVAGVTIRVSVDSLGTEAVGGMSASPSLSPDGRYVAFESDATNLVSGDSNGLRDVFLHDTVAGTTTRISVDSAEAQAVGGAGSGAASISADGAFVAFNSTATNLVATDTNGYSDIFVRDVAAGTTTRVSLTSAGQEATGGGSFLPAITPDGRYVAFESFATDLVALDTNAAQDIFVRDRTGATTVRASVDSAGAQAGANSYDAAISSDGQVVVFQSVATDLVTGDSNTSADIFARDLAAGTTTRVSVDSAGSQAQGGSSFAPTVSADGRYVSFGTGADNLVANDTNGLIDIFVHDRTSGVTSRVSIDSAGAQLEVGGATNYPAISADGRFVAFRTDAANLVAGDTNGVADIFRHGPLF